jgi:hypothetical protein
LAMVSRHQYKFANLGALAVVKDCPKLFERANHY